MNTLGRFTAVASLVGLGVASAASPITRPADALRWTQPTGIAVDRSGGLLVTDLAGHRLFRLDRSGALTVVAGTGVAGFSGDGAPAVRARLNSPHDVRVNARGEILIADTWNHRIRRIDRRGIITTLAGSGGGRLGGDGGPARRASLNNPQGIGLGPRDELYIADTYNHVVRRVDARGVISTFAGTEAGLAGDGGPAARAQLSLPTSAAPAPDGSVYISDSGNNRIRRVRPDGTIETVLGTGPGSGTAGAGYSGDGGPAVKARIFAAAAVAVDPGGRLLISDTGNHRIRTVSGGIVATLAGSGAPSPTGLSSPQKVAPAPDGSVYVADRGNGRVVRIEPGGRIHAVTPKERKPTPSSRLETGRIR